MAAATSGSASAIAAPTTPVSWALWPQQWEAPVSDQASGWLGMGSASISPITARVGPSVEPLGFR